MSMFYDQFVDWDGINSRLSTFDLTSGERDELLRLLDETIHFEVMKHLFEMLPLHVHEHFIIQVKEAPHSHDRLHFIKQYHPNVEDTLRIVANKSTNRFLDTIHSSMVQ
jgi:hypothetical protein